jgi:hypothetical protein
VLRRIVERMGEDEYRVTLSAGERELLHRLPAELRSRLEVEPDDPTLHRLFPPAYEQAEEEVEYRRLMHDELLEGRREALKVLEETADRERLDEEELHAWLGALNDLRLVLGTRLDVSEELYQVEPDPRDARAPELALYLYLTWLQEELVAALSP